MFTKIKKLLHLITMIVAVIATLVFGIIHACTAMDTPYGTLALIMYILMFIWASCRVIILMKEYHRSK